MIFNFLLLLVNLAGLAIGLLIGEYEVAKLRHPDATWITTPGTLDLSLSGLIVLMAVINLAALFFVLLRRLDNHRPWLTWSTALTCLLVIILAAVLGLQFLPILWPTA